MKKVALGEVFSEYCGFFSVSIISPMVQSYLYLHALIRANGRSLGIFFGIGQKKSTLICFFCVNRGLRLKKQLSIEHIMSVAQPGGSSPVDEINAYFTVRIKK